METRLLKLKADFNNIINIRGTVKNVFDILQVRIDKLHQIYSDFIKNNKNEMFVFGLDSFHFQSKLIDIEYEDMKRLFLAINNRMYCEYFKLHKIIVDYIIKNVNDIKVTNFIKSNNYPIYKDLEPFKEYKFELVLEIHENILNLVNIIISILNNKENELSIHITKQNIGLNIDNFITTFNFNINVMREKILMFITYIEFFHKMHTKYLKRFSNKIQLIYTHINNDIKFDDTIEVSKNKKKELIEEFVNNHVDKELLKDLKNSIGSESNSENDSEISKSSVISNLSNTTENINKLEYQSIPKYDIENLTISKSNTLSDLFVKEKKDYKSLFKKNVHKVSNILQLCKRKETTVYNPQISSDNIDNIFSDINKSCDSILDNNIDNNNNNNNIGLKIEFLDSNDNKNEVIKLDKEIDDKGDFISNNFDKQKTTFKHISKDEDTNYININLTEQNKTIQDNELVIEKDNITIVEPEKNEVEQFKKTFNEEEKNQVNLPAENIENIENIQAVENDHVIENIQAVENDQAILNDNTKKKRKYNKKKI